MISSKHDMNQNMKGKELRDLTGYKTSPKTKRKKIKEMNIYCSTQEHTRIKLTKENKIK
jgi:hypothetical protein